MKRVASLFCVASLILIGGCAYDAPTEISASYSVYSNYNDKIPGIYGLHVDAEKMKQDVKAVGTGQCSAYSYPVDARNAFTQSVYGTFENLVEEMRSVDNLISAANLQTQGIDGMIIIKVENWEADFTPIPTGWVWLLEADSEITASIQVIGHKGNLLGSTIEASDEHSHSAGLWCEGGSVAVSKSVEASMKKAMDRLGERLTNSVRVREAAPRN